MAIQPQNSVFRRLSSAFCLRTTNYELRTNYMQNKPNFRKAKMNISPASTKDYENISPVSTMKKQTQSNPISSAIALAKADSKRDTLLLKFRQGTVKLRKQKAGVVHLING